MKKQILCSAAAELKKTMKISKSKQELARIISENGGWVDCEAIFAAMDGNGDLFGYSGRPQWTVSHGHWYGHTLTCWFFSPVVMKNHHQTILSREEYFHLYPAPDAEAEQKTEIRWVRGKDIYATPTAHDCMEMLKEKWGSTECGCDECSAFYSKPAAHAESTIEQLAADYRNAKDYAERKQQEADDAKADADEKLRVLEIAGEALGLLVSPITEKQGPELVITDWRDLQAGDVISVSGEWWEPDSEYTVDENEGSRDAPIKVGGYWAFIGECSFKFIRRP